MTKTTACIQPRGLGGLPSRDKECRVMARDIYSMDSPSAGKLLDTQGKAFTS